MPRPPPPVHAQFKPGQSGNKGGRPKGQLTADQVSACIGRLASLSYTELKAHSENKSKPTIEVIVATILVKAADTGDYSRLESLLARSIGKVKDVSEVHQHNHDAAFDSEPRENVIELLKQMRGPQKVG